MGGGTWTSLAFNAYTTSTKGMNAVNYATYSDLKVQEAFKMNFIHKDLDPKNVMRECLDTEEHPNTVPVILALDVTGSMGDASMEVSKKLGMIMESIYDSGNVPDVEFCIMAIGDLYCDSAPVQISQFESDIRIAEHLDKVYFEGHGGGNAYESYTAAWYMGLNHCKLDCWKRGKKGIIITMGDERLNPYLQKDNLSEFIGDNVQESVKTEPLFKEASEYFDIHHISVDDYETSYSRYNRDGAVDDSWKPLLRENYHVLPIEGLKDTIVEIITSSVQTVTVGPNEISW